jgi:DNA repair protein SbcC/Rad50
MIQTIQINNFQSHKHTHLTLDPGVNIIVGPSDSGKTAILRALRWLVWNRPTGEAFRSSWGGETLVEITVDDLILQRSKDKENIYKIVNGNEVKLLKAFGTEVPEEIKKVLNLDDSNLQQQMDAPFLISSSPGDVAAHFNKIARLDQIDSSLKLISQGVKKLSSHIEQDKQREKILTEQLKFYDFLDFAEIDLEALEALEQDQLKVINDSRTLEKLINSINDNDEEIKEQELLISFDEDVNAIIALYEKQESVLADAGELKALINRIEDVKQAILQHETLLSVNIYVEELETLISAKNDVKQKRKELNELVDKIDSGTYALDTLSKRLKTMEEKFHKYMPEVCPLCGK